MIIKVLGPGCSKCVEAYEIVSKAVAASGSDATVAAVRAMPMPPHAVELCFPDRWSLAVFSQRAFSALTPEERGLVFGRVMEGRSYEELSQIYGPSAAALRKRYERARKKLALALSESELDEQKEVVP